MWADRRFHFAAPKGSPTEISPSRWRSRRRGFRTPCEAKPSVGNPPRRDPERAKGATEKFRWPRPLASIEITGLRGNHARGGRSGASIRLTTQNAGDIIHNLVSALVVSVATDRFTAIEERGPGRLEHRYGETDRPDRAHPIVPGGVGVLRHVQQRGLRAEAADSLQSQAPRGDEQDSLPVLPLERRTLSLRDGSCVRSVHELSHGRPHRSPCDSDADAILPSEQAGPVGPRTPCARLRLFQPSVAYRAWHRLPDLPRPGAEHGRDSAVHDAQDGNVHRLPSAEQGLSGVQHVPRLTRPYR